MRQRNKIQKALLWAGLLCVTMGSAVGCHAQGKVVEISAKVNLPLVIDAQPKAVIVTVDKPGAAAALGAKVLAEHLLQISGARLPIVKESALKGVQVTADGVIRAEAGGAETFVLVGESNLAKQLGVTSEGLGSGGIRLRTVGNALVLLGSDLPSDSDATLYAVTSFLEDHLGVRYLWPGESGKVIPQRRSIALATIKLDYTPTIQQRRIRSTTYGPRHQVGLDHLGVDKDEFLRSQAAAMETKSASPSWHAWQHLGGSTGLVTGHAFGYIWKKYGEEHPEWFALQPNGSRDQSASPDRSRLCVSNQELQTAIARDKIEELDRNPGQTSVSIDPNDGGAATFCMCPECKKLDPPQGRPIRLWDNSGGERKSFPYVSLTDRMLYFWNGIAERVVKERPNALLAVRAYSVYSAPPLQRKLHPSIVVEQVSGDYFDSARTAKQLDEWTQWSNTAKSLAWRPNIDANNRRHGFPTVYVQRMGQNFKARAHAGMISTDVDSMSKSWATNGLNLYVLARLHWNPDLDVDDIVDDYCRSGFGPGAPFIKEYFQRIAEITEQAAAIEVANPEQNPMIFALARAYDAPTIAALGGILDRAQEAAKGDEAILRRIAFVRRGLSLAEVQAEAFRMVEAAKADGGKVDKTAVLPFMTKRYAVMRDIYQQEPLAIDIPYLLWGGEGNFRLLQSKQSWAALAAGGKAQDGAKPKTKIVIDADENGRPEEQEAPNAP